MIWHTVHRGVKWTSVAEYNTGAVGHDEECGKLHKQTSRKKERFFVTKIKELQVKCTDAQLCGIHTFQFGQGTSQYSL